MLAGRQHVGAGPHALLAETWTAAVRCQEWAILDSFDLSELDDALFGRVVCTDYSAGLQEEEAEVLVKMLEGTSAL